MYSGLSQSFFFGGFPPRMGKHLIGYVMASFGAAEVIGSVVGGRISDKIGRRPVVIVAGTIYCITTHTHTHTHTHTGG